MNGIVCSTTAEILRNSETPCLIKSIRFTCIQDVEIKFTSAINIDIFDNSIANLNAREFLDPVHFRIFSSMKSRMSLFVTSTT